MSPGGPRGRLSILIFHRVLDRPDPLAPFEPDVTRFEACMRWIRGWFNVLPLTHAIDLLDGGTLPPRALSITFDDGYADNELLAAPILERLGMTATFFVATGFLGGGTMWNDRVIEAIRSCASTVLDENAAGLGRFEIGSIVQRRDAISAILKAIKHLEPERRDAAVDALVAAAGGKSDVPLMMQPDQVRRLRARGMGIGAHTISHPILARLGEADARHEIARSKSDLEHLLDERIDLFAYPNGMPDQDYRSGHVAMVRECGFKAAVSTAWGAASVRSDRFQLPRFTPWDRTRLRYGVRLVRNFGQVERTAR
jgi:peptidoglycan/xylan/chitin deacetylase (PgdA/CDA1 family)